ncbi:hypothetical protein DUNSADRAFT_5099 [Dunaliella salina]|uniref:DUF4536 domain-containing protein n=1 Tax=Dunaliella salina TaxID=3046 RepID=A0ABQ7HAK4_DUNSA|nr:hypothetical protein DUNSADRAFT_5099 [Dunaliella salina]|eukprot:KAF5843861.1 hypothetical protein DUNSADRAFT_5099 [Dunaliella salina]
MKTDGKPEAVGGDSNLASLPMSNSVNSSSSSSSSSSSINNDVVGSMDCLGCRLTGLAFGLGGGGYIMSSLLQDPPPRGAHKASVIATAGAMLCFGMYRALL